MGEPEGDGECVKAVRVETRDRDDGVREVPGNRASATVGAPAWAANDDCS